MKYDFLNRKNEFKMDKETLSIVAAFLVIITMLILIFSNSDKKILNDFQKGKTFKCFDRNYYIEINKSNSKFVDGYFYFTDGYRHYLFPPCKCSIKD